MSHCASPGLCREHFDQENKGAQTWWCQRNDLVLLWALVFSFCVGGWILADPLTIEQERRMPKGNSRQDKTNISLQHTQFDNFLDSPS